MPVPGWGQDLLGLLAWPTEQWVCLEQLSLVMGASLPGN